MAKLKSADDDEEQQERDLEELAAIESQLYVVALLSKEYDEGIKAISNSIDLIKKIYGDRSRKLSSKYF